MIRTGENLDWLRMLAKCQETSKYPSDTMTKLKVTAYSSKISKLKMLICQHATVTIHPQVLRILEIQEGYRVSLECINDHS